MDDKISKFQTTSMRQPETNSYQASAFSRLRGLVMGELLVLLVELVTGVYIYLVGPGGIGQALHSAFGIVAGLLGIVLVVYSSKQSYPALFGYCILGTVWVAVAGVSGFLFVLGHYSNQVYTIGMGVSFVLSGFFFSEVLRALRKAKAGQMR
ncbi:MAG: hypothetical protein QW767_00825 [Thermoprotei archaeon]